MITDYNFKFIAENGDSHTFDWDEYPVDLAREACDIAEDIMASYESVEDIVVMSFCPAMATVIVRTPEAYALMSDEIGNYRVVLERVDGTVMYSEPITARRDGDTRVHIDPGPRKAVQGMGMNPDEWSEEQFKSASAAVLPMFPGHKMDNSEERFRQLSEADRQIMFSLVVAVTTAVVQQVTD